MDPIDQPAVDLVSWLTVDLIGLSAVNLVALSGIDLMGLSAVYLVVLSVVDLTVGLSTMDLMYVVAVVQDVGRKRKNRKICGC